MWRKLTKGAWIGGLVAIAALMCWIVLVKFLPWNVLYWSDMREGDYLIAKVEKFRTRNGRLPNPAQPEEMVGLGFKDLSIEYRPDFKPVGSNDYELVYQSGFDGPYIKYSSLTKQWICELCE